MYEERIAFLCKVAKNIKTKSFLALKSSYLLRCQDLTKSCSLPEKHFNLEKRCPHCLLEWKTSLYETKIKSSHLSKKQRYRIRKTMEHNSSFKNNKLLHFNVMEKKCLFCNKVMTIQLSKPNDRNTKARNTSKHKKKAKLNLKKLNTAPIIGKEKECINVYSNAKDVFTINNKNNTVESEEGTTSKIIKNNKRKKDKFAGLCKAAVIASAKLKQTQVPAETNKLNLFLRKAK